MKLIPFFGVKRENKKYKKIYSKIINNSLATGKSLQGEEIINLDTILTTYIIIGITKKLSYVIKIF